MIRLFQLSSCLLCFLITPAHLDGSVDADQLQDRLLHLRQELREEQQDLLHHPWRILREEGGERRGEERRGEKREERRGRGRRGERQSARVIYRHPM